MTFEVDPQRGQVFQSAGKSKRVCKKKNLLTHVSVRKDNVSNAFPHFAKLSRTLTCG